MSFWSKPPATELVVTQSRVGSDGKAGSLTIPGVATIDARDGFLFGKSANGYTVLIVPLAEVAAAIVTKG